MVSDSEELDRKLVYRGRQVVAWISSDRLSVGGHPPPLFYLVLGCLALLSRDIVIFWAFEVLDQMLNMDAEKSEKEGVRVAGREGGTE